MSILTNYLYNRTPLLYGGHQEDYQIRANSIIDAGVEIVKQAVESKKDLPLVFRELLSFYQERRGEIARDHGTLHPDAFGKSRLSKGLKNIFCTTPLSAPYEAYNEIYLNQLEGVLKPGEKKWIIEDKTLGRKSLFEVEIFSLKDASDYLDLSKGKLQQILGTSKSFLEIVADQDLMQKLKERHIEVYQSVNFNAYLSDYINRYPDQLKKNIVFGTLRLEMDGKMYAFSRYLSTFNYNTKESPVESLKKSPSLIAHQDIFLLEKTLQEVSTLFAQAVQCERRDLPVLKDRVKLFRMYFSHYTPSLRGDGAIGDWLELTLYRYHQYTKTFFKDNFLPCFESLSSITLSRYVREYDNLISIG